MSAEAAVEILLVEDNPSDLELALHALKRHHLANRIHVARDGEEALDFLFGAGVRVARDGVEALDALFDAKGADTGFFPRLVLLDLKLPKVDGLDVLRRIKGDPQLRKVPVVVLTSSREERDVVESYELGVNSYIVKPVDFDQFTEAVRQLGLYWVLLNQPPIL
jgi:two-component system response regulator